LSMWLTTVAAAACMLAVLWPHVAAEAQRLRVDIFLTQARIPDGLTERGLIGFVRSHRATRLQESTEDNPRERRWYANAVFSFNRPPGDLEFHALFYDVHDGPRNFVREMSVFVSDRTQRTVLHRLTLPRPIFRPNRRMEMVVTVQRQEVGSVRFELIGEEPRHTGQVDFTDEEARQRD
ncbi:MAG TPA: hypothetical protein VIL20_13735, partial [Sandaracinaceae bacterium]